MFFFLIEVYAPTASFRLPEAHTFQQTLPLPPVTSLVGMAGAALGLSFPDAMQLRIEEGLLCAVWGRHNGGASDLWKFQKIKAGEVISAVLTREILYDLELKLVYALKDRSKTIELRRAFLCPVFALTAGTSDDLLKVKRVSEICEDEVIPYQFYENTILPGDHSQNYESSMKLEDIPLNRPIYAPRVFLLPTSFEFRGNERRVKKREHFTFIDTPVTLKKPIHGISMEGRIFPLL